MMIQDKIKSGIHELVWSYILEFENEANPDEEVRLQIAKWREIAKIIQLETENEITNTNALQKQGLSEYDAIHIACAVESKADLFLTTDKDILKKNNWILLKPRDFLR